MASLILSDASTSLNKIASRIVVTADGFAAGLGPQALMVAGITALFVMFKNFSFNILPHKSIYYHNKGSVLF